MTRRAGCPGRGRARRPRPPATLSAWDKLQLGLARLRDSPWPVGPRTLGLGPPRVQLAARPRPCVSVLPEMSIDPLSPARTVRRRTAPGGLAAVTTWFNSMTHEVDLTGTTTAAHRPQGPLRRRGGLRLPFPAGLDGRDDVDDLDGTVGGEPFVRDGSDNPAISGSSEDEWLDVHAGLDANAGARSTCGSCTAPTGAWLPTASSPTRSSSPGTGPRCSAAAPRTATRAGPSTGSRRPPAPRPATSRTTRRVAPQLRVLRPVPGDRAVQLRLRQHEAGLRGALQLHAGPAHLVLGHVADGQQHERAPGRRVDPAHRLAPTGASTT